jgi:hypothetical protein
MPYLKFEGTSASPSVSVPFKMTLAGIHKDISSEWVFECCDDLAAHLPPTASLLCCSISSSPLLRHGALVEAAQLMGRQLMQLAQEPVNRSMICFVTPQCHGMACPDGGGSYLDPWRLAPRAGVTERDSRGRGRPGWKL